GRVPRRRPRQRGGAEDRRHGDRRVLRAGPEGEGLGHRDRQGLRGHDPPPQLSRSEEHTSELQSQSNLVCRLLLEKKKKKEDNIVRANTNLPKKAKYALSS